MNRLKELTINKEGFAFDPRTGESYRLNESAQHVMACLQAGENIRKTAKILSAHYGLSIESALEDVQEFQLQLKLQGLLE
ncbi:MAG: PqqD family protein [Elusimicrobiota bacterium]